MSASGGQSGSERYDRLLSVLTKSLAQSRDRIASDAPRTIKESYGDMTSLFTSSEDGDGVSSLVDLLLGKLDSVHDRFGSERSPMSGNNLTILERLLEERNILGVLRRVEAAIEEVERDEREFDEAEEADRTSAREAIRVAKSTRVSPSGKKRRVPPAENIGYRAYRLKVEYQQSLAKELEEIEKENKSLEEELEKKWREWQENIRGVKAALDTMDALGGDGAER